MFIRFPCAALINMLVPKQCSPTTTNNVVFFREEHTVLVAWMDSLTIAPILLHYMFITLTLEQEGVGSISRE